MKLNANINYRNLKSENFAELKDSEILRERLQTLELMTQYAGDYFSKTFILKNVLKYNEDEIDDMKKEIEQEIKDGDIPDPNDNEEEN